MAHPFHPHRQHKVEHRRVEHITKGYAHGGAVHDDEAEDRALIRKEVKKSALMDGEKTKHRADKRARGGRTKHKGTTVNVIVPGGGARPMMPPPGVVPPPAAMPPRPPMAAPPMPPPGAVPPGGPPGMAPRPMMPPGPPMPIRRTGGAAYAKGGAVKDGPAWKEGLRNRTQVWGLPGKNDGNGLGRGKPITYAAGGPVEHPVHGGMGPKFEGGAGGGEARLEKEKRAARNYAKA